MYRPLIVTLILLAIPVIALSEPPPSIGAKFNRKWAADREPKLCMTHPAQMDPCVEQVFDGVKYQIAYSNETRRVSYLYTDDENFRTVDGLKVGDLIPVSPQIVHALPGWQIHAQTTRDGWRPIMGYDLPQIKLNDGTVLDLANKEDMKRGTAVILGFSKGRL